MESYNYGIKEETTMRLVGEMETWNRLVLHPPMCGRKKVGGTSQEQGIPASHQVLQPRVSVPGR